MSEMEMTPHAETEEEFTDELSDEALDREGGRPGCYDCGASYYPRCR